MYHLYWQNKNSIMADQKYIENWTRQGWMYPLMKPIPFHQPRKPPIYDQRASKLCFIFYFEYFFGKIEFRKIFTSMGYRNRVDTNYSIHFLSLQETLKEMWHSEVWCLSFKWHVKKWKKKVYIYFFFPALIVCQDFVVALQSEVLLFSMDDVFLLLVKGW